MLVAVTVLMMMMVILVSLSSQAGKVWSRGESQNQNRQRARASLDYIGQELRQALLPLDAVKITYQFQINPSGLSTDYQCRDAIFWQAPIATDTSQGDLAEIGYFVQWNASTQQANLCRFFVNPSDSTHYLAYGNPTQWVTDTLLQSLAPATKTGGYQGLFLENVIGLWITATKVDGLTAYEGDPHLSKKLPASVDISLVTVDSNSAKRMKDSGQVTTVKGLYGKADAAAFVEALQSSVKNAATTVKVKVSLDNYK